GQMQHRVGGDHADEGHARQVEALRDHLRADDHARSAGTHLLEQPDVRSGATHGVAVETHDRHIADELAHLVLDALRAAAEVPDLRRAAARARLRLSAAKSAAVAEQFAGAVPGEGHIAARTLHHETATAT